MDIRIRPKPASALETTALVQQTTLWARVKRLLGWSAMAFDLDASGKPVGDMLVVVRDVGGGSSVAYVPYGPEGLPDDGGRGEYLAALSGELRAHLPPECIMTRWDLPWESPYALDEDRYDDDGHWLGAPETRVREARMNFGVRGGSLRKAPSDILPPDTLIVDLRREPDEILASMRPKTRYNIGLAARRGVAVRLGGADDLPLWRALYEDTARRNRMSPQPDDYFSTVLRAARSSGGVDPKAGDESITMLVAEKDGKPLAAMFMSVSADRAAYLYGASSSEDRNLMAPYALQWAAMNRARAAGCASYDLFGVAPRPDPDHPMYGLYVFKSGFGGSMLHRQGAWDYAYDGAGYASYVAYEAAGPGFIA
ncbi:MAG TPA: peptidoglycan bridge formation glycyltransferase FemA/FemB family protein [Spirochaetales bacterium]|nr:peptidoglycan bridge formation glycyltransferase FemA/FemB family protein [Spirochaetales bacterium]